MGRRLVWMMAVVATAVAAEEAPEQTVRGVESLPGTYECIQRVSRTMLQNEGIGMLGRDREGVPEWADPGGGPGLLGEPVPGTLTLAANQTFSLDLGAYEEGTWEVLQDEQTRTYFLRLTGGSQTLDADFKGFWGLPPGEIGLWVPERGQLWMYQFRKTASVAPDPYTATEAQLAGMFGQGKVAVDFAQVAKGSATGVGIANGVFDKGTTFASSGAPGGEVDASANRVVLVFVPDGRFTIETTLSGKSQNGTYVAETTGLRLKLLDAEAEESWEIGLDQLSGRFAIRPAGSDGGWFFEVPLDPAR